MRIAQIHLENYRACKNVDLMVDNFTVLVGRNGAGKSTFLSALATFYDVAAPISEEDFYNRDTSVPIIIRVTYTDLRPEEQAEFEPYLQDGRLTVTKRIELQEGRVVQRYFAAVRQIPEFAEIRSIPHKLTQRTKYNQLVETNKYPGLPRASNAQEVERAMAEYEAAHPELCEFLDREEQFFGPKNVGGGKLDKYTRFVHVPAVQEASDEVEARRGSYLYQLLDIMVYRRIACV